MAVNFARKSGLRLPPLPTIRDLIRLYKLRALKQLSQNFLLDERITDKIVKAAGHITQHNVLEIGPGPGGITRSIIKRHPKHLVVIEKDERFFPSLELLGEACQSHMKMDIILSDILKYPCDNLFSECAATSWTGPPAPVHLIGNLPFSISTKLLINWLQDISLMRGAWTYGRATMTLTFQKEVAERIVAPIMAEQRCRLSVMSQLLTKPEFKFVIPGKAFVPKPDVDVGVVTITPLIQPLTNLPFGLVEKVVRHIFSMRQKYVRRGIANLYPPEMRDELTVKTFDEADIDPTTRSFQLSNEECVRLADVYQKLLLKYPEIDGYNYRAAKVILPDDDDTVP